MNISCRMDYRMEQRLSAYHSLTVEQRQLLKQLFELRLEMRAPKFPSATRGFEGMDVGDNILKREGLTGILIGGLAESVWNRRRTLAELEQHKDVDILVFGREPHIGAFEGGIDWWTQRDELISVSGIERRMDNLQQRWWENENGVALSFGVESTYQLLPGLYIPSQDFVIRMRVAELRARYDPRVGFIDEEVLDALEKRFSRTIKTTLPTYIRRRFAQQILSEKYETNSEKTSAVNLEAFSFDVATAIYKHV
jgi:hypothetical protein